MMRDEPVSEPKPNGKPFAISKRLVWEAWRRVKANHGAAGVDEESIQAFEANLKGNLYKVWNRMSSGSYNPPPVKAVEIPKKSGGSRMRDSSSFGGESGARSASGGAVSAVPALPALVER